MWLTATFPSTFYSVGPEWPYHPSHHELPTLAVFWLLAENLSIVSAFRLFCFQNSKWHFLRSNYVIHCLLVPGFLLFFLCSFKRSTIIYWAPSMCHALCWTPDRTVSKIFVSGILEPVYKSWLCASFPNFLFSDIMLVARN